MTTITKQHISVLKAEIKKLVAEQKADKKVLSQPHVGSVYTYQNNHRLRRLTLRSSYIAYGLLRGKTINQIESKSTSDPDWSTINALMNRFTVEKEIVDNEAADTTAE